MLWKPASVRKCLLSALVSAVFVIIGINIREASWFRSSEVSQLRAQIAMMNRSLLYCSASIKNYSSPIDTHDSQLSSAKVRGPVPTQLISKHDLANLPWYFKHGERQPLEAGRNPASGRRLGMLLPEENPRSNRITDQLMFVPPGYKKYREGDPLKTILLYTGIDGYGPWNWRLKLGRDEFIRTNCPVDSCELTTDRDRATNADLVAYYDKYIPTEVARPARQVFMIYFLESPVHRIRMRIPRNVFNWTATYRMDSDVVAPYEKWEYYNSRVRQQDQDLNYAINKTKKVAWFVSNCQAHNGRQKYGKELAKYIQVDIYGKCGTLKCPRTKTGPCFEMIEYDYKFYLAFENSNCKDYITEKLFVNSLKHNILPIVMGARPIDYVESAPFRSYIHVDDFASAKELADYLHLLDRDDALYNSYFQWKGTGEFIETRFWCRVCAMLHDEETMSRGKSYTDVIQWWGGRDICRRGSWR